MRRANALLVLLATAVTLLPSCRPAGDSAGDPKASPTPEGAGAVLTGADIEMFLAVRAKALTRLENEVAAAEDHGGSVLSRVAELSTAERDAVGSLGFDWRRYRWVREEVASLVAAQRQREDSNLLTLELTRARDDLLVQLKVAKDPASRQFLEAQVTSLDTQLEKLKTGRPVSAEEAQGLDLIAGARAELAVQQGRQDRIQRRVRDLVQRERAGTVPAPTAAPRSGAR